MPGIVLPNLTFIHIPKTGGTSIGHWLYQNSSDANSAKLDYVHKRYSDQVVNRDTTTFAVVRNPWDRMVSLYFFIKSGNFSTTRETDVKQWQDYCMQFEKYADFKAWLKDVPNLDRLAPTGRTDLTFNFTELTPQVWWLDGPVTHLLRFETLQEDFKIIQDLTNCYTPLNIENESNHDPDYRVYYDDESRELVATWFADDIKQLGYEF